MSAGLKVHLNARPALQRIDVLIQQFPRAAARALNRAGVTGRAVLAREIAKDLGMAVSKVKTEIKTVEARPGKLAVRLSVTGARIPLINFGARGPEPSRGGRGRGAGKMVTARLKGGRGSYPGAFIAKMRSGHRGVFIRGGRGKPGRSPGAWSVNLPIAELSGPSLPYVFIKKTAPAELAAGLALRKNLQSELRFAISKKGGSANA